MASHVLAVSSLPSPEVMAVAGALLMIAGIVMHDVATRGDVNSLSVGICTSLRIPAFWIGLLLLAVGLLTW